jgi:uncharacterized protein YuzE
MATQLKENLSTAEEWIKQARRRVKIPKNFIEAKYSKDVDSLYIQLLDSPATHSDDDLSKSLVFDYDKENRLVGIEVMNLYGVFV